MCIANKVYQSKLTAKQPTALLGTLNSKFVEETARITGIALRECDPEIAKSVTPIEQIEFAQIDIG